MGNPEDLLKRAVSRRSFVTAIGGGASAAALVLATGCGGSSHMDTTAPTTAPTTTPTPTTAPAVTDADILNFALNLEYLEAEFYLRAATGQGLTAADIGASPGTVTGGQQVTFATPAIQQYAMEIAMDELAHVRFLRKALGSAAVDRPAIDLTNSFTAAGMAAGITTPSPFNPFADENAFLLGAFVFEDVGVTAYHGAAPLLSDKGNLAAAAGIYATEAYHAGMIRTLIAQAGDPYVGLANQISKLRQTASDAGVATSTPTETPVAGNTIVASDSNSIAFDRNTDQVLHIVYLGATAGVVTKGGFFPNGMNGNIKASAR